MELKIGDKVRVRKDLEIEKRYDGMYFVKEMKKFKGKVVTIEHNIMPKIFEIKEDDENWRWTEEMFEPVDIQTGDIVTMKNEKKYRIISRNWCVDMGEIEDYQVATRCEFVKRDEIVKIERPTYSTIYESKKEILEKKEKEYLSVVIKPFRCKVKYICKSAIADEEFIRIVIEGFNDTFSLPNFEAGKMYKGMKAGKEYTLEELGL